MERKHPLALCEECPLQKAACAPTSGPLDAEVAIVSRSPGYYDIVAKKPFAGPSGQVLDHLLKKYEYNREDVLTTNVVLCETDNPPLAAINACKPRLYAEIDKAKTIIAAGGEAAKLLARTTSVTAGRGFVHSRVNTAIREQRVIVTNNPAMVLRNSDSFPDLVEDFKLALDPPPPTVLPTVEIISDWKKAKAFIEGLIYAEPTLIASDLEGHMPHIECVGFATSGKHATVLTRDAYVANEVLLKHLYTANTHQWLWHNGQYDCKLLWANGIEARVDEDTFPLSYVLDERPGVHSLGYLLRLMMGWPNYEPESVEKYKETGKLPDDPSELYDYNGKDTAGTYQLFEHLEPLAHKDDVHKLYKPQYINLMNSFVQIELRGFGYDQIQAADLNEEVILPKLRALRAEMQETVGLELYNPNSSPQTKAIVYDTFGLKHKLKDIGKKKKSTSFDKDVRREIVEGRFDCKPQYKRQLLKLASTMDTFSTIDTQRGTFIEGLINKVREDGKLSCEFNPCGTVSGRTSSRKPNFQNITRSAKDVVPGIRTLFHASDGCSIVQADYSQAELRTIAVLSEDKELLSIYYDTDRSLHHETTLGFYGEDYDKEQYTKCKVINFGIAYGQSAFSFAQMYQMDEKEAQAYIDQWFRRFPAVQEWIRVTYQDVQTKGVVVNPFGRKRRFHLITKDNLGDVCREGVNALAQGTASDFTINALNTLVLEYGVPVVSTIHDSIIADVPDEHVETVGLLMKQIMEAQPSLKVGWDLPFKVDISVGKTWGDAKEVDLLAAA